MVNLVNVENVDIELRKKYLGLYSDCAIICSEAHMKVCPCQEDLIVEETKKIIQSPEERTYRAEHELDEAQCRYRNELIREKAMKDLGKTAIKVGLECPVEQSLIVSTIHRFDKNGTGKYNLKDPDVFMILKSMINNMLSAHRMQLYSRTHGIVQTKVDREGNLSFTLNPVETAKLSFDKAQVDAVEKLNKIVYGNRNLNLNVETDLEGAKSIAEIMTDIRLLDNTVDVTPTK